MLAFFLRLIFLLPPNIENNKITWVFDLSSQDVLLFPISGRNINFLKKKVNLATLVGEYRIAWIK